MKLIQRRTCCYMGLDKSSRNMMRITLNHISKVLAQYIFYEAEIGYNRW
jgi:hypothetical protein